MIQKKRNRRVMLDNGWGYRCSRCDTYKESNEFHKDNSKPPFYLAYTCKECRRLNKDNEPMITLTEKEKGLQILSKLGYDITKDIPEQFINKIKLKYGIQI